MDRTTTLEVARPVRAGEGAVASQTELLRALLLVVAAMDVVALLGMVATPAATPIGLASAGAGLLVVGGCEILRRGGHVGLASHLIIVLLWLLSSVAVLTSGGNSAELSGIYAVLIVSAGLLLSRRAALGYGAFFALTLLSVLVVGVFGLSLVAEPVGASRSSWGAWILAEVSVAMATATIVYATRLVEKANAQMRYVAELTEHVSDAVISTDLDFRIRSWNRAAERLYGWKAEEAIGRLVAEIVPTTYAAGEREDALAELRNDGLWAGQVVQHDRQGHAIDIMTSVSHMLDAAGRPTGAVAVNRDSSKRTAAERALRKETELTQAILDSLPGMFFMFDQERRLVRWNVERERILGYGRDEMARMGVAETIAPEDRENVGRVIDQVWTEGNGESEHRVLTKDGRRIPVSARGRRVTFDDKAYVVGMSFDIRERVRMEDALRASEARYRDFVVNSTEAMARLEIEPPIDVALPAEEQVGAMIEGGYLAECNARFATMYGLGSPEDAVGVRFSTLLQPTVEDARPSLIDFVQDDYSLVVDDVHALDENGRQRIFRSSVRGAVEDGRLRRLWAIRSDLTEQRSAEAALRRSEARWRSYIDQATDFILSLDAQGRFTSINPAGCAALGYTEAELLGIDPLAITAPEHRQMAAEVLGRMLQGEEAEALELDVITGAGKRLTLEITGRPFVNEGRVEGTFHIARDITRRRDMERELRISEQRYRTLVEQLPFSLIVHGADGRTIMANRAAQKIWQLSQEQMDYMLEHYNVRQDEALEAQGVAPYIERAFAGEPVTIPATRFEPRSPDGEPVGGQVKDIRGFVYPVKDDDGSVREVVVMHEDVTERRRAEEVLRQAEKLESLGLMSGGLAHDFNNLLTAVLGHASLARDKLDGAHGAHEHLLRIVAAAERASSLTEQLLAYSGRGRFHVQPIDLNRLIEDHLPLLQVAVPSSVRLETALEPELPAVEADEAQLQQLVMNIVINACEAAAEGEGWVRIVTGRVRLDDGGPADHTWGGVPLPAGEYLRLSVQDGGPGIDEETRRRIFDPFFTTKDDGHGLGLAAVLGIVRGHDGGLRLESTPGVGTTFEVLLPVTDAVPVETPKVTLAAGRALTSGTVLVIDDEAPVRDVVAAILEDDGIATLVAEDGEAGIAVLEAQGDRVRVILLDLTMPGISGEETCRRIRELQPNVPVIATSGYSDLELDERLAALGVVDFLKKPYPYERLTALVRQYLADEAGDGNQ